MKFEAANFQKRSGRPVKFFVIRFFVPGPKRQTGERNVKPVDSRKKRGRVRVFPCIVSTRFDISVSRRTIQAENSTLPRKRLSKIEIGSLWTYFTWSLMSIVKPTRRFWKVQYEKRVNQGPTSLSETLRQEVYVIRIVFNNTLVWVEPELKLSTSDIA